MVKLKGGRMCACLCHCSCTNPCSCSYAGSQEGPGDSMYGGSSVADNGQANFESSLDSQKSSATESSKSYN